VFANGVCFSSSLHSDMILTDSSALIEVYFFRVECMIQVSAEGWSMKHMTGLDTLSLAQD
jgi:hypothetical protein